MKIIGKMLGFIVAGTIGGVVVYNISVRDIHADIVVREIIWAAFWIGLGIILYRELFGISGPGYRINREKRYLTVKDFCQKTIFLEFNGMRISISMFQDQLWLKDIFPEGSSGEFIESWDKTHNDITLKAGKFHIARQRAGYRVSWIQEQHWNLQGE